MTCQVGKAKKKILSPRGKTWSARSLDRKRQLWVWLWPLFNGSNLQNGCYLEANGYHTTWSLATWSQDSGYKSRPKIGRKQVRKICTFFANQNQCNACHAWHWISLKEKQESWQITDEWLPAADWDVGSKLVWNQVEALLPIKLTQLQMLWSWSGRKDFVKHFVAFASVDFQMVEGVEPLDFALAIKSMKFTLLWLMTLRVSLLVHVLYRCCLMMRPLPWISWKSNCIEIDLCCILSYTYQDFIKEGLDNEGKLLTRFWIHWG